MILEDRLERARGFRAQGYNCAQCVAVAFPDVSGLSDEQALRITIGLGGGCGCGETCGVLSCMAVLLGRTTQGAPSDKASVYGALRELHSEFTGKFGSAMCRELKTAEKRVPCNDLIYTGIEMLHNHLEK